jgi:C_GCAxxG_C_C family probable redox protein
VKKTDKAVEYFRDSFNCSQSVFTVFGTGHGLSEDACLKASCAFGGGIGRTQNICGAVTGALMALGLEHGKGKNDPDDKKKRTYELTREFMKRFSEMNGSLICKELLDNLDMNDPEQHKKITDLGLFEVRCEKYVSDAVSIAEELSEK